MRSNAFEKSIKGATKPKNAAPKSKYIEHVLTATHSDAGVAELFRTLQLRLRDSTWTIVFKSLIVIHMMIREGAPSEALRYLSQNSQLIAITGITEVQVQGNNIWRYSEYIVSRSKAFAETKTDYVREGQGRLKRLSVAKGLLRETEIVQRQIQALIKCDLLSDEPENEITLTAFRLLTLDLLTLFSVMNEGTINVLEHYFEMSRTDSERALKVYKRFGTLTEEVVNFLRIARQYEHATRLEIPNLKHASTDLTKLLEDDLKDPDFSTRRREYRSQKYGGDGEDEAEKNSNRGQSSRPKSAAASSNPSQQQQTSKSGTKAPAPDLIDFFGSIEQNQQPMNPQPQSYQQPNFQNPQLQQFQQTGFQPQQTGFYQQQQQPMSAGFMQQQPTQGSNPFGQPQQLQQQQQQQQPQQPQQPQQAQPLQQHHTGTGFGGYTPQANTQGFQSTLPSIPQDGMASFQRPMHTGPARANNPFRQSMLPPADNASAQQQFNPTSPPPTAPLERQNTNPFAKHSNSQAPPFSGGASPFSSPAPQPQSHGQGQGQMQSIQPQRTGTNPFAKNTATSGQQLQPPAAAPLRPNLTGSTNPFRQSAFIDQQTGQGWQNGVPQGTMGGHENQSTVPVFPRPGQMI